MRDELEEIRIGATWQNVYDCLWTIATYRYVTKEQLDRYFPEAVWKIKIATPKKLEQLVQKGFLKQSPDGVFVATNKAYLLLKHHAKNNCKMIKLPSGNGQRDSVYNTEQLLQIRQLPGFYALFYPVFYENKKDEQPFLIPDGAVVFKNENLAKLVFVEIENPKPEWRKYLEEKRRKYELVAQRGETWSEWWNKECQKMGLHPCSIEDFGFMIWCVGEFRADWDGWSFFDC